MFTALPLAAVSTAALLYVTKRPADEPPILVDKLPAADTIPPPPAPGQHSTTSTTTELPVRYSKSGVAATRYPTLVHALKKVAEGPLKDTPAFRYEMTPYPTDMVDPNGWKSISYKQFFTESQRFARALISVGMEAGQGVTIIGFNAFPWMVAHVGVMMSKGTSAGSYPTNNADLCTHLAKDSDSVVAVCDTMANAEKYLANKSKLPHLRHVIVYTDSVPTEHQHAKSGYLLSFNDFLAKGDVAEDSPTAMIQKKRFDSVKPETIASIIFTSGTVGMPKGVMITHDAMMFEAETVRDGVRLPTDLEVMRSVSYLPLSHIAAQLLDIILPIFYGLNGRKWCVYFARPDVMKGSMKITLQGVRPTAFFGVPRVWEKIREQMIAKAKESPSTGVKKMLIDWARSVGTFNTKARAIGGDGVHARGTHIAQKLVFNKVLAALGLQDCTRFFTGAAPTTPETFDFFSSFGVTLNEVWGLSECTGVATCSNVRSYNLGFCGCRLASTEVKIDHDAKRGDHPGEGEILVRGRQVMAGYLNNQQKTDEAIDAQGFLHTGDVGKFDDATGQLKITGRIKELIVTAGGENIAPVPIEAELQRLMPAISNAIVIGDKRKYNVVLITLRQKPNLENGTFFDELIADAKEVNPEVTTVAAAAKDNKWNEYITAGIKKYNNSGAASNATKVQKFYILPTDFSVTGGELTSTMKLRRNIVSKMYEKEIDSLY